MTRRSARSSSDAAVAASGAAQDRGSDVLTAAIEDVRHGELDQAIGRLRASSSDARSERVELAFLERQRGDYDRCVATLDRVLAAAPQDGDARLQRAYAQWLTGRLDAAEADLTAILASSGSGGTTQALVDRAEADRIALREERHDLAPVAAASGRLDVAFDCCLVLAGVILLAASRVGARRR